MRTPEERLSIILWSQPGSPVTMRPPPTELTRSALSPVMIVWTMKAMTSSRDLRLVTRLGEIICRDLVMQVNPTRPDAASPERWSIIKERGSEVTDIDGPGPGGDVDHLPGEDHGARLYQAVDGGDHETQPRRPEDQECAGDVPDPGHQDTHHAGGEAAREGQHQPKRS